MEFFIFLGCLIGLVAFPIIGSNMGARRNMGSTNGALLGLFLGLIGIVIISCYPTIEYTPPTPMPKISGADELKKYKELLDSGAINEVEYNIKKGEILNR